ncbi:MAG: hypothetical protein KKB38_20575 [Gammaproteobacteria bacterium]|nr:hypothetical protein [Gammaproteobacteria bacterium]
MRQLKYFVVKGQAQLAPEALAACLGTNSGEIKQVLYGQAAMGNALRKAADYLRVALKRGAALAWIGGMIGLLIAAVVWWLPYTLKFHPAYLALFPLGLGLVYLGQAVHLVARLRKLAGLEKALGQKIVLRGPYVSPPFYMHAEREEARTPSLASVVVATVLCVVLALTVLRTAYPIGGYHAIITNAEGTERIAMVTEGPTTIPLGYRWALVPKRVNGVEMGYIYYAENAGRVAVLELTYQIDNPEALPPMVVRQKVAAFVGSMALSIARMRDMQITSDEEGQIMEVMAAPLPPEDTETIEGYIRQAIIEYLGGRPRRVELSIEIVSLGQYQDYLRSK